jgi:hypothetical protein
MDTHRLQTAKKGNIALQAYEVAFLRQEISTRERSIAALLAECESYKALLSPLRSPAEILGEIFHHTLQIDESDRDYTIDEQLCDICLVCKAWRQAALATPRLWSTIESFPLDARSPGDLGRAKAWFQRAGSLPRTIGLVERDHGDEEREYDDASDDEEVLVIGEVIREAAPCPLKDPSLAAFLAEASGLERVTLSCHSMQCLQGLMDGIEAKARCAPRSWDSMRSLELRVEDGFWDDDDPPKVDLLRRLPHSLIQLQLDLPCFLDIHDEDWVPMTLSSPNLTELELSMSAWPTYWALLCVESCPSLQTLTIDLCHNDADWDTVGPWTGDSMLTGYTLPLLHTLRLRNFVERQSTTKVLQFLNTPSLTELDISFDCPRSDLEAEEDMRRNPGFEDFADHMHAFMLNSGCKNTLRRVRIHALVLPWNTLQSVLEAVSPITQLTLDGVWSDEPWPAWPTTLLPSLQALEILEVDDTFDPQSVFSFAQARSDSVHTQDDRLKRLKISMVRKATFSHPNGCAAARKLRKSGVEIEVVLENPEDVWVRYLFYVPNLCPRY